VRPAHGRLSIGEFFVTGKIWTGFANTEEDCADAYVGKTTMLTGSGTGVVSHKRIGRLAASWRGTLQA
jgi:hypothetical protein